ncbi:serine proteinase [Plectosphaerella plurivora]|uniref:Serine proteinase n=1 Tax=Plectosphaerella plurivora TaxID=936078 RepID=A0A9P8V4X8_9PEZI|nr:serine proteinase [Plectosphaerella plurivora]
MPSLGRLALFFGALLPAALAAPVAEKRNVIAGKYIVTLKSEASTASHLEWVSDVHSRSLTKRDTVGVEQTYNISSWHAYAGEFDDATLEEIKNNPDVAYVEEDTVMYLWDDEPSELQARAIVSQTGSTWGLGTISSRTRPSTTYRYDDTAGVGSYAYVVDSGVIIAHSQFGGRATNGWSAFTGTNTDTLGHGTHVAATIAGSTYGVAKRANVISVKVFQGREGTTSGIIGGINWAVNDIVAKGRASRSVINLSLGGPSQQVYTDAIRAAYNSGVLSVVAAGNGNALGVPQPVANYSPANVPEALTVAAIDSNWRTATFTNYGPLVDVFAPGVSILSAGISSNTATATNSGTSMAAPHVAGLALYLQVLENINTPAAVTNRIVALSTTGSVTGTLNGSPNRIVYNGNA